MWTLQIPEGRKGLSGSTLKLIAVVSMIIDHTGAALLGRYMRSIGLEGAMAAVATDPYAVSRWVDAHYSLYMIYEIMRYIGRIAFPIYCFMLIEGFYRTKTRPDRLKQYVLRLFGFGLISEIPFDLAFRNTFFTLEYQNVFFELLVGLLTVIVLDKVLDKFEKSEMGNIKRFLMFLSVVVIGGVGAAIAECSNMDYGMIGIICILVIYVSAKTRLGQCIAGGVVFMWETTAPLAFIPIWFYNGKRGMKLKYFFYLVYPVHIGILYLISLGLGLGAYSSF